jgi:homeobox protein cut-like
MCEIFTIDPICILGQTNGCSFAEHFTSLEEQHRESLQTAQDQKSLIAQLEADLGKVQPFLAVGLEGNENASLPSSAEIISEAVRDVEAKVNVPGEALGGASSLLPIVSSQRERFKQRNVELEAVSISDSAVSCQRMWIML